MRKQLPIKLLDYFDTCRILWVKEESKEFVQWTNIVTKSKVTFCNHDWNKKDWEAVLEFINYRK